MINFNQDLAWDFYACAALKGNSLQEFYDAVVAASGAQCVEDAVKNCGCDINSYNNTDDVAQRIWHVLHAMPSAPLGELYGYLIPEFFCLANKALEIYGKTSSQSIDEGSEEISGGS